jgi:sugar (pentulose or hexulose) kinase
MVAGMGDELLIGLDLGTSAIKGILMEPDGKVIASEKSGMIYNVTGRRVEFDGDEYFRQIAAIISRLSRKAGDAARIKGISMASASGNTLLLDKGMRPVTNVISWTDERITDEMQRVYPDAEPQAVHETVGWPFIPSFPLAHLAWFRLNEPEAYKTCGRVCMSTDYVNYRLTGEWGIDTSTATTFYLQDQKKMIWNKEFLDILELDEAKLPPLYKSGTVLGRLDKSAAEATCLIDGTPVVLGAFDHPCAARGTGILSPGQAMLSCGTSWVGFFPVRDREAAIADKMLVDPFLQPEGPWGAMLSVRGIGQAIDWYIDKYISSGKDKYAVFNTLAAKASNGSSGLRIRLDVKTEAVSDKAIENEIKGFSRENISRAIMEAAAFLIDKKLENLKKSGTLIKEAVMVGGPSESPVWQQIIADITGINIIPGNGAFSGAMGAAVLAGIGVGIYRDEYAASEAINKRAVRITPARKL